MRALLAAVCVLLASSFGPAVAQNTWREFRSEADGFSIQMPQTPTITARRIGKSEATQTMFLIDGPVAYLVSVIAFPKGTGPKAPDQAYFQARLKDYESGSATKLRSSRMVTLAGKSGIEGITEADAATHIIDVLASGDRLIMVVYAGAKGQEASADSKRFRESLKLIE